MIAAARELAVEVTRANLEVDAIYLVGSVAAGTSTGESDIDLVAFVSGTLRPDSNRWWGVGESPERGFPTECNEVLIHWCFYSNEYPRSNFEENAAFRGSPAVLLAERSVVD
jgi:Nucleotidyltransferase domain